MSFKVARRPQHQQKSRPNASSSSTCSSSISSLYQYEDVDEMGMLSLPPLSPPPPPQQQQQQQQLLAFKSSTLALAHFLASTGPEEFSRPTKNQKMKQPRILDRLRKKRGNQTMAEDWVKFRKQTLRDSGVYSEVISDKVLPSYETTKSHTELNLFPKPPSVVLLPQPQPHLQPSSTTTTTTPPPTPQQQSSSNTDRSHPSHPTSWSRTKEASTPSRMADCGSCPHCRQILPLDTAEKNHIRRRRLSCPPALAGNDPPVDQHVMLRDKIARLEAQLAQERQSRIRLEEAMSGKKKKTATTAQ